MDLPQKHWWCAACPLWAKKQNFSILASAFCCPTPKPTAPWPHDHTGKGSRTAPSTPQSRRCVLYQFHRGTENLLDVCVTSANALKIVRALPNEEIIFIPDENLGRYIASQLPEKTFIFNDGRCPHPRKDHGCGYRCGQSRSSRRAGAGTPRMRSSCIGKSRLRRQHFRYSELCHRAQ